MFFLTVDCYRRPCKFQQVSECSSFSELSSGTLQIGPPSPLGLIAKPERRNGTEPNASRLQAVWVASEKVIDRQILS